MPIVDFLSRFEVLEPEHNDNWNKTLADMRLARGRVFWYPASGLHLDPLGDYGMAPGWRNEVDLYLYADYTPAHERRLREMFDAGRASDILLNGFGERVPVQLALSLRTAGQHLRITEMIPLQPKEIGFREALYRTGREGLPRAEEKTPHSGAAFWYLVLQRDAVQYRLLFAPVDHFWLLKGGLIPCGVDIEYLCAHKDGCAKGGAWVCCNDSEGAFFRAVMNSPCRPKYWITDHWAKAKPAGFLPMAQSNWGGYGGLTRMALS